MSARWWWPARRAAVLCAVTVLARCRPAPRQAHPLGNVTVNHYDGLRLYPDRSRSSAVVDHAEIPTLQLALRAGRRRRRRRLASGGAAPRADAECAELSGAVSVTVDGAAASLDGDLGPR